VQSIVRRDPDGPSAGERRAARRYAIRMEMEYRLVWRSKRIVEGRGHTINLSSAGLLLEAKTALPLGAIIELTIAWPARISEQTGLSLKISGRTVRSQANRTAVVIRRYEFYTRAMGKGRV
jgi:hypothetical protein